MALNLTFCITKLSRTIKLSNTTKLPKLLKNTTLAIMTGLVLTACQQPTTDNGLPVSDNTVTDNTINTTDTAISEDAAPTTSTVQTSTTQALKNEPSTTSQVNNAPQQVITQPITILALGDSLTEGLGVDAQSNYPAQLQQALRKAGYVNATVVNSGLSGETSSGLVNRLDWVLKTNPDITILTTGANDAMRGIDATVVDKNIRSAIERLQHSGSTVILGGMQIYDNMGDEYVRKFSDIYPTIAEDTGVAFIPFFLEGVAGDATLNQADAIHPTAKGYTHIVNDNILPVLQPTLEAMVADTTE